MCKLIQNIDHWQGTFSPLKRLFISTKSRNLLSRKLELFSRDIQPKREQIAKNAKMKKTLNTFRISTK